MNVQKRNNVRVGGAGVDTIIFAHGFGCDQNMWRLLEPSHAARYRTVLFDHVGAGESDLAAYAATKYATLAGYAEDVVQIAQDSAGAVQSSLDTLSARPLACWPTSRRRASLRPTP